MEENKKRKGVGPFAVGLTIICILGLAIMGYFIYYLLNARKNDNETIQQLRDEVANIRTSVVEITDKTEEEPVEEEPAFTDAEIIVTLQKCLDLHSAKSQGTETIFETLGYTYDRESAKPGTKEGFMVTTIKFDTFKNDMLKYMTEDCYDAQWGKYFEDEGGVVAFWNVGATGTLFKVNSIEKTDVGYTADITVTSEGPATNEKLDFTISDDGRIDSYDMNVEK